jgi:hypothetical protein
VESECYIVTRVNLMPNNGRKVWVPGSRDAYASLDPIGRHRLAFPHEVRQANSWSDID